MTNSPDLRAGDADRDRTIGLLRDAYSEGRLTHEEFEVRLEQAHAARTFGELDALTSDLPAPAPAPAPSAPAAAMSATGPDGHSRRGRSLRAAWASWLGVSVLVNVIWLATWVGDGGDAPSYWPIWVMGPWGAAMLIATLAGRSSDE